MRTWGGEGVGAGWGEEVDSEDVVRASVRAKERRAEKWRRQCRRSGGGVDESR